MFFSPLVLLAMLVLVASVIILFFVVQIRLVGYAFEKVGVPPSALFSVLLLVPEQAPLTAYMAGTMGTLMGADRMHLPRIRGLGTPVVSIGGARTFAGVFLTGIIAVLLA